MWTTQQTYKRICKSKHRKQGEKMEQENHRKFALILMTNEKTKLLIYEEQMNKDCVTFQTKPEPKYKSQDNRQ